jgi:hypothetical protein
MLRIVFQKKKKSTHHHVDDNHRAHDDAEEEEGKGQKPLSSKRVIDDGNFRLGPRIDGC